ncbi:MAG: 2,3-bisphosphoglycerate-independent phosphoglycerate mutase [Patescibacteria group bacterium]
MSLEALKDSYRPVVLLILDGFGIGTPSRANAISQATKPVFDRLIATYPTMTLQASGEATGLPWAEVGNSEVGHMNIGAGRIVYQELTRITNDILSGGFEKNEMMLAAMSHVKTYDSALHLIGMTSSGGVHSHIDHLFALLETAKSNDIKNVYIHVILDGRDTPRASGIEFIKKIIDKTENLGVGTIASISGRFYAMDRDNHWDRIENAYRAMVEGVGKQATDPISAVQASHDAGIYDEEFESVVLVSKKGVPLASLNDNDAVIMYNFRADRMRELSRAIVDPAFDRFTKSNKQNIFALTMTQYEEGLPVQVAYPPQHVQGCLSKIISDAGLTQLHIAETEKYAHVTYFLNGGIEQAFVGEERILIPSPRITSYAEKPEMSARGITDAVNRAIKDGKHDFIAVNFANADMVGHTGDFEKTKQAIEIIDGLMGNIADTVLSRNGAMIITADHGNAEHMFDVQTGQVDKGHTNNPVPCIVIASELEGSNVSTIDVAGNDLSIVIPSGLVSDIAPTILHLLGILTPTNMTGHNLLEM